MSKKILFIAIGILIAVFVLLALMEDTVEITKKEAVAYRPPVSVLEVTPQNHQGVIKVFAEIKPHWSVNLKAHVGGEVIEVSAQALAGEKVQQGAKLIRIEQSSYQAQLDAAEQALAEAKLELLQEQKKANQAKNDWKRSGIKEKPSDLTLNLPQLEIAKKRVKSAESQLQAARKNLEYTQILAPFSGYVTARHVSRGQTVSGGDPLVDIINDTQLDVALSLSTQQWNLLEKKNWQENLADIYNESGKKIAQAKIVRGGGYLDPETRQYKLFLEVVQGQDSQALSGEFVHVHLPGVNVPNTLKIPESAQNREGEVWFVDDENRLQRFSAHVLFHLDAWLVVQTPELKNPPTTWKIATNPLASFLPGSSVEPHPIKP